MSSISKMRFSQFVRQARGVDLTEIHVNREDKGKFVLLRYNGRAPKSKNRLTGEWQIPRAEKDEAAIDAEIQEFLGMARKHFFVRRGDGLTGDKYADAAMEAEVKPIVGSSDETEAEGAGAQG